MTLSPPKGARTIMLPWDSHYVGQPTADLSCLTFAGDDSVYGVAIDHDLHGRVTLQRAGTKHLSHQ